MLRVPDLTANQKIEASAHESVIQKEAYGHSKRHGQNEPALAARAIQDDIGIDNLCYGCGPENPEGLKIKSYWDGDETVCTFMPRPSFMAGPRHVLNGGIIATVIDCHCICTAVAAVYKSEGRPIGSDP